MATHLSFFFICISLLIFSSLPIPTLAAKCNKDDKKVLLRIKAEFGNPYHLASWTNNTACCDWYDVDCDSNGRVIGLSIFQDTAINGTIPPSIGDLPYLQNLLLHKLPQLIGGIPTTFTRLTRITMLRITWTGISGPVPDFLSEIKSLNFLDLSFNSLTGSIPASLGTLPNLNVLHLDRNRLTGTIPDSLGNLVPTASLYLSHNMLSGSIPRSLGSLQTSVLDLSRNQLVGDASFLFGAAKPTDTILISRNLLEFDLTKVAFPVNLSSLDLSHNKIYGKIPAQITALDNLQFFNASYNSLCGEIPQGGRVQNFDQYSFFHNKCLCGAPLEACK
ncbi:Polygalacturonase inhibitor 1 [Acorus calamus]|uniref:Polygalacturonase inhibitor 1 n=1 Tax=Acorus calamus TaxID=4465 RepID=A0AAV9C019_ACOCL|nr:Polygalacturonase inhibitor 1 [Acorus calamus]